jgi:hypothetical protein
MDSTLLARENDLFDYTRSKCNRGRVPLGSFLEAAHIVESDGVALSFELPVGPARIASRRQYENAATEIGLGETQRERNACR